MAGNVGGQNLKKGTEQNRWRTVSKQRTSRHTGILIYQLNMEKKSTTLSHLVPANAFTSLFLS
jgi:hypothetical protein